MNKQTQEYKTIVYEALFYYDKKWPVETQNMFFYGTLIHYKDFMKAKEREFMSIPPRDKTPILAQPNKLTVEQAFALFMERYAEAMKELAQKEKDE